MARSTNMSFAVEVRGVVLVSHTISNLLLYIGARDQDCLYSHQFTPCGARETWIATTIELYSASRQSWINQFFTNQLVCVKRT